MDNFYCLLNEEIGSHSGSSYSFGPFSIKVTKEYGAIICSKDIETIEYIRDKISPNSVIECLNEHNVFSKKILLFTIETFNEFLENRTEFDFKKILVSRG